MTTAGGPACLSVTTAASRWDASNPLLLPPPLPLAERHDKVLVALTAPSVRISIGEEVGLPPGTPLTGQLVTALKQLGFDYVFGESRVEPAGMESRASRYRPALCSERLRGTAFLVVSSPPGRRSPPRDAGPLAHTHPHPPTHPLSALQTCSWALT